MIAAFIRPLIIQNIVDRGLMERTLHIVINFSIVLVVVSGIEVAVTILQTKLFVNLQNEIVIILYSKVFRRLLYAKMDYFSRNNTSEILNRISTDIGSISSLFDNGIMGIMNYVLQIASGVAGLFVINWKLALLVLVVVPIKYFLIRFFSKKREENMKATIEKAALFSAWFDDSINGIKEIKLWNLYGKKIRELKKHQSCVLLLQKQGSMLNTYNLSGDTLIQWIMTGLLYSLGGVLVCQGQMTIGSLTAFISYGGYVIGPIALIFNLKILLAQIKPSIERLREFSVLETERNSKSQKGNIQEFCESISFEHISFGYKDQHPILKDVNIKIEKGEKIAIIGENGSGKSTFIQLMLRFLKPQMGAINIDGKNINGLKIDQYRDLFALITQDIYLFKDSIRNNVTLGKDISDRAIYQLFEELHLQKFMKRLPQGLDTVLERNGDNLSGGERQRLAFIRAILKDAPILVMDEATSNIDQEYEEIMQKYITNNLYEKTIIIITHKNESLRNVDKIYKISDCKVEKVWDKHHNT